MIDTSRYEQAGRQLTERPMPKDRHAEIQGNIIDYLGPKARAIGLRAYPEGADYSRDDPQSSALSRLGR